MDNGLLKDIKGYHIHVLWFSNLSIDIFFDAFTASPVIVAGGLPNLVIQSSRRVFYH